MASTKVVTGKVRLSYVHVFEPYSNQEDQEARYSCTILIPKSDKKTLKAIEEAIGAAKEAGKTRVFEGRIPASLKTTLHDGDEEADLERNPEYAGHMYMAISAKQKPGVVDLDLQPILDTSEVYSGCYARVSLNFFAFNSNGNKGIACGLGNIQKVRDGEPLGGKSTAADDFATLADDDFLA